MGASIKAVFFDIGGVLGTDLFPLMDSYLSGLTGVSFQKVVEIRKQYWLDYELGRMDGIEFFRRQIDDLGVDINPEEVMSKSLEVFELKEEVIDIVKRIRATERYDLGVISNNTDEWAAYVEKDMGVGKYFDAWIISSHHHVKKPDKEIFDIAAERLGINTADCVFIDNKKMNVEGAESAGMKGIVFKSADQLEFDLKKMGVYF